MAGETVLIVEDRRENIVHLANNVLKPNGYQVITAMDGQRGLQRIVSDRPDLVILDLNMPKMDGLEVLAALQERKIEIPIIFTTFYGSEQVAQQALRLGATGYVVKPYKIEDMLKAIDNALTKRPSRPSPQKAASEEAEKAMPLTRQVERWMRDMNILTRVGKALVAQLDLEKVYARAVEAAIYVTRADHAFLYLKEEDQDGLRLCATRGPEDPETRLVDQAVTTGLAVQVANSGEAIIRTKAPVDVALFEVVGNPLGPMSATPMRWQRRVIGVLAVARSSGEASFTESDVEWLSGLADYAAIAVENARACQALPQQSPPSTVPAEQMAAMQERMAALQGRVAAIQGRIAELAEQLEAASQVARQMVDDLGQAKDPDPNP